MIETLISLGIMGILVFIAAKMEVINHNTDLIVDMLIGEKGKPPLTPPAYDAGKHSDYYPFM